MQRLFVRAAVTIGLLVAALPALGIVGQSAPAEVGQFPSVVSVRIDPPDFAGLPATQERHHCGGSLIAPNVVLTAGHCVYWGSAISLSVPQLPERFAAVIGGTPLSADPGSEDRHAVVDYVTHPTEDLALMLLATSSDAPLQRLDAGAFDDAVIPPVGTLAGWGTQALNGFGNISDALRYGTVPFESDTVCLDELPEPPATAGTAFDPDRHTCTFFHENYAQQCLKDSGSPILIESHDPAYQVSLASWASGNAENGLCGWLAVQARVAPHLSWIREAIDDWDATPVATDSCDVIPHTAPPTGLVVWVEVLHNDGPGPGYITLVPRYPVCDGDVILPGVNGVAPLDPKTPRRVSAPAIDLAPHSLLATDDDMTPTVEATDPAGIAASGRRSAN